MNLGEGGREACARTFDSQLEGKSMLRHSRRNPEIKDESGDDNLLKITTRPACNSRGKRKEACPGAKIEMALAATEPSSGGGERNQTGE